MRFARKSGWALVLAVCISAGAWAQRMRGGMGQQPPSMPGVFKPVVGAGAQYEMDTKSHKSDIAWAVVGHEDVNGSPGYWMEIRTESPEIGGETVMKQLMVLSSGGGEIKRMIMQAPGRPPMEMPMGMMSGMPKSGNASSGGGSPAQMVGTEPVTVPAGTFVCEHFRKQQDKGTIDYWVSTQVSPYGVVKMTGPEMNLVLKKVLSGETSHIKGEPQKMQMPEMPHF
jgi:hypothetical protein